MKSKTEKPKLFVGKAGTGKTFNAICEMGKKETRKKKMEVCFNKWLDGSDDYNVPSTKDMSELIYLAFSSPEIISFINLLAEIS